MANIIRGRKTLSLRARMRLGIAGLVGWDLIHARTQRVIYHSPLRPNLIVNSALEAIGTGVAGSVLQMSSYAAVGTNNTAPANSQTELVAQIGTRVTDNGGTADVYGVGPDDAYVYHRRTWLFAEDNANGNLQEFGTFSAATLGTMFNRQLLRDDLGDPTAIVKTSEHQLRITMEKRIYRMVVDSEVNDVMIGGVPYDTITRQIGAPPGYLFGLGSWSPILGVAYESSSLPAFGAVPSGNSVTATSASLAAYVAASKERAVEHVFDPGIANWATGVGAWTWTMIAVGIFAGQNLFITNFTPKIPKTNVHRLKLTAETTWDRA